MLNLSNCRDKDHLVTANMSRLPGYIKLFTAGHINPADSYRPTYLYQLSNKYHLESDYPFSDFDIFDYKDVWINCLKSYINNLNIIYISKLKTLPKHYYHFVYQYYMIKENQHYISEEAKAEVQKIHDLEVPGSYIYKIKELIDSL